MPRVNHLIVLSVPVGIDPSVYRWLPSGRFELWLYFLYMLADHQLPSTLIIMSFDTQRNFRATILLASLLSSIGAMKTTHEFLSAYTFVFDEGRRWLVVTSSIDECQYYPRPAQFGAMSLLGYVPSHMNCKVSSLKKDSE